MSETLPLFSRTYERRQLRTFEYHDQLNTWSARIRIANIQFQTNQFKDDHGQQKWEAVPLFPKIYLLPRPLHQSPVGYGRSKEDAQAASYGTLRAASWRNEDIQLVRWSFVREGRGYRAEPFYYDPPAPLEDPEVVGVGSSRSSAIEKSARGLLLSEYYCVTW